MEEGRLHPCIGVKQMVNLFIEVLFSSVKPTSEITGGRHARLTVAAVTFFLKILIGFSSELQPVRT